MEIPQIVRILFVEDNDSFAELMKMMLASAKFTTFKITRVSTLKEGLSYLCKKFFDVVLLDMILPNSAGIETFLDLHNHCPEVPVVIVSGFEDLGCEAVARGAQDFLVKTDLNTSLIVRSIKYAIERKKLELEKAEKDRMLSQVISATPLGTHIYELVNNDLVFIGYNQSADRILEIDHSDLIGKKINEAFPGIGEDIDNSYKNVIRTGVTWDEEEVNYEDDRISGIFEVHAFKTSGNKLATQFIDITEKRRLEEDLKSSKAMYQEIVESTNAAIYEICFRKDRLTYVNDVMCKLTGWTREELLNMSITNLLTEKSRDLWLQRYQMMLDGRKVPNTVEYEVNVQNGTKWVMLTASYKYDENNTPVGARVIALDITDKKMAQLEAEYKEELVYSELEQRLIAWRKESFINKQIQNRQLEDMNIRIMSINNGVT